MAEKKPTAADLKKLVQQVYKLDPMKPMPKTVKSRMDKVIDNLAAQEKTNLKKLKTEQTVKNVKVNRVRGLRGGGAGIGPFSLDNLR
jgi:hypothetical protein